MGCLKLSYYPRTELKIISSKKVLTLNKTENNYRSSYLFGFNGVEKDNEIKGEGKYLAFGDYGYDPRIGRRNNIDPQNFNFPYESNYSFVSNNPIIYKDVDGQKKIIYLKFINETTGKTQVFAKEVSYKLESIVVFNIHSRIHHKEIKVSTSYNWYDINQVNTLTVKQDGSFEFQEGKEEYGKFRTTTNSMSEGWANFKTGDIIKDFFKEEQERGKQAGGYVLKSEFSNNGDGPKTDATEEENPKSINIDLLLILGELGGVPDNGDVLNWAELISAVGNAVLEEQAKNAEEIKPLERISSRPLHDSYKEGQYAIFENEYSDGSKKLDTCDYNGKEGYDTYGPGRQTKRDVANGVIIKEGK